MVHGIVANLGIMSIDGIRTVKLRVVEGVKSGLQGHEAEIHVQLLVTVE
jgi:hypothetical protein